MHQEKRNDDILQNALRLPYSSISKFVNVFWKFLAKFDEYYKIDR